MKKTWLIAVTISALAYAQTDDRAVRWHEDLQALSAGLKAPGVRIAAGIASRGQKDFAILYPNFDREIQSIEADVPQLSDAEVVLRLMRLMASAHVAHNTIETPGGMGFFKQLPVEFVWFPDGLAVAWATADHVDALGARVTRIGELTPEDFLAQLEPYISYENAAELHMAGADLMKAKGVLQHFHLIGEAGSVSLELEKPNGEMVKVSTAFVDAHTKMAGIAVIRPLVSGLASRRKSVGPVYVLIGPYTFSSAVDNAIELQRKLSAKLVGAESGGMPGGYGEVARLTLPNSKLVIRYTTKNFGNSGAKTLVPDISAPLKIADFLAGRDPVLDAAIHAN